MSQINLQPDAFGFTPRYASIPALLEHVCNKNGAKVALRFHPDEDPTSEAQAVTYSELFGQVNRAANLFNQYGVTADDTVAICLPNLPETLFALFGAQCVGKSLSLNPFLESEAIIELLNAASAKILLIESPSDTSSAALLGSIKAAVPSLEAIFVVGASAVEVSDVADFTVAFSAALASQPAEPLASIAEVSGDRVAAIFHTGGTTGTPKLAQLTHSNEIYLAQTTSQLLKLNHESIALCGLPLFHVNAVFVTTVNVLLSGGTTLFVTKNGFRTKGVIANLWKFITRYQVTFFSAVPTIVSSLLERAIPPASSHNLQFMICGAAPVSKSTLDTFRSKVGIPILEGYGLTEGTCVSTLNPLDGEQKIGSIGQALPYQEIICAKINAQNTIEKICGVGEQGTVLVRGPNVFKGYVNPGDNTSAFTEGWLNTGDLGKRDEEGYFWLTGRAKDLIIRGGHNIDPKSIEDVLNGHPDVLVSAAVGQPDSYSGELPCAYVALNEGADTTVEALLDYLKANLKERAAIPVHIDILEKLPLTSVGKIFKPQLRYAATLRVVDALLTDEPGYIGANIDAQPNCPPVVTVRCSSNVADIKEKLAKFAFEFRVEQRAH